MTGKPQRPFQEKPPKSIRHFTARDVAAARFTGTTRLSTSTARVSPTAPSAPGLGAFDLTKLAAGLALAERFHIPQ